MRPEDQAPQTIRPRIRGHRRCPPARPPPPRRRLPSYRRARRRQAQGSGTRARSGRAARTDRREAPLLPASPTLREFGGAPASRGRLTSGPPGVQIPAHDAPWPCPLPRSGTAHNTVDNSVGSSTACPDTVCDAVEAGPCLLSTSQGATLPPVRPIRPALRLKRADIRAPDLESPPGCHPGSEERSTTPTAARPGPALG